MTLLRGFKTWANRLANEVRGELSLGFRDRLNPWVLAAHLSIPILPLSELVAECPEARYFLSTEPAAFSAATVFDGARRTIVHNDAHNPARQASDLAHELAHGILLHEPSAALDARGCRAWNQDIEDEAVWLSGVLLIPDQAALWVARQNIDIQDAARLFGVSESMVRYRLNISGAVVRTRRARGLS